MQDAPNRWSSDQALMRGGLAESDHRSLRPPSIVSLPLRVEPSVTSNRCPRWAVDTPALRASVGPRWPREWSPAGD
jgi:hypothetical protein